MKLVMKILVLMLLISNNVKAGEVDGGLFIYNYPTKIYCKSYIRFIRLHSLTVEKIDYTIYHSGNRIKKIEKGVDNNSKIVVKKTTEGNLVLEDKTIAYTSENFKHNTRMSTLMHLLSNNFLELDNEAKLQLLDSLHNNIK